MPGRGLELRGRREGVSCFCFPSVWRLVPVRFAEVGAAPGEAGANPSDAADDQPGKGGDKGRGDEEEQDNAPGDGAGVIEGGESDGEQVGAASQGGGEDAEAVEAGAGVRCHGFCALAFLRLGRGKVAARRAAADRAGLGRLARSEAALMEPPQCGHISGPVAVLGVCGVIGFVLLLAFGPGVDGDVFGGAENGL